MLYSNPLESHHSRRSFLAKTALGAMGFGALNIGRAEDPQPATGRKKSVIYIFLSGGLGQQDSFDPKPNAPAEIRGEFAPISTSTPGVQICEHLPKLAQRSERWSLVRSLSHAYNEHSQGHMVMLSGYNELPLGFDPSKPKPTDHPSIAAITGALLPDNESLPPAMVLPEKLIHRTGRVIPGQFAGIMGARRDPHFLAASRFNGQTYGAWPEYGFHHQRGGEVDKSLSFRPPILTPPEGITPGRSDLRLQLLDSIEAAQPLLGQLRETDAHRRYTDRALTMLSDPRMRELFEVTDAPASEQDRYGRNTFGWSLLLAKRLVTEGVRFVQVNLGNNETWDTHGNAFPHLKNYLLPPFDLCLSALLDDLHDSGLLDDTLVVVAGEFGRTPKVFGLPAHYKLPGRDHWGAVQSVLVAGGGISGGQVLGATDKDGGQPVEDRQTPANLAATIYSTLGFSGDAHWYDLSQRPIPLYNADRMPLS